MRSSIQGFNFILSEDFQTFLCRVGRLIWHSSSSSQPLSTTRWPCQKVHLLHRARGHVPFYVSLAECQIVLEIMKHEEEAMALVGYARVSSVGQRLDVQ